MATTATKQVSTALIAVGLLLLAGACSTSSSASGGSRSGIHSRANQTVVISPTPNYLTSPVTWEGGTKRFDPPSPQQVPQLTPQAAFNACQCSLYSQYSQPQIWFASYTDFAEGQVGANGGTTLNHVHQPAWIVLFQNVPGAASGGAHPPGQSAGSSPIVNQDVLTVVSDTTGQSIIQMIGMPDPTAQAPPSGV
jgi:hypothetical protein